MVIRKFIVTNKPLVCAMAVPVLSGELMVLMIHTVGAPKGAEDKRDI